MILVTGGAGFLGRRLCAALRARGEAVRVLDDLSAGGEASAEALIAAAPGVELLRDDLLAPPPGLLDGVEGVVHLAARSGVRESFLDPEAYARVNVLGTRLLLEAAAEAPRARSAGGRPPRSPGGVAGGSRPPPQESPPPGRVRVVIASSSSVYGARPHAERRPFEETDPLGAPTSPYAASKADMEREALALAREAPVDVRLARLFTVYGPGQRSNMAVATFLRELSAGRPAPLRGDGSAERDLTYVEDAVSGLLALLDAPALPPGGQTGEPIVNLGGGAPVRVDALARACAAALGVPPRMRLRPAHPGDVPWTGASLARAATWLGWAPGVSLAEGLERMARDLR